MTSPIPLAQAQMRLLDLAAPMAAEQVQPELALGRFLAADIAARRTQPSADLSAMDGYALRAGGRGPWEIIGESAAGHPFAGSLGQGQAIRISTGALMPAGADAILLQENADRAGDTLKLNGQGEPTARHIRPKGFDFALGETVLHAGACVGPAQLALALGSGAGAIAVHSLPRIAILDSGDELCADPAACAPHQIPASNGAMLAAMATPYAQSILRLGPVADNLPALAAALERAGEADVIVTSGGASVGDHDLIRPALEAWGAKIDFWRVAMKPGKPILVAQKGSKVVLGLPGNPVSSYVTAFLFLLPLLRRMAGARNCLPTPFMARLNGALPAGGNRQEFQRAWIAGDEATPIGEQDSSALRALAASNALIERPIGCPQSTPGDRVPAYLLQNGGIA